MKKVFLLSFLVATAWANPDRNYDRNPDRDTDANTDGLVRDADESVVTNFAGECVQEFWVQEDLSKACRGAQPTVFFDVDKSNIKPGDRAQLRETAKGLRHSKEPVVVRGYADYTGSEEHNRELSQKRSEAAKRVLVGEGMRKSKVTAEGEGVARRRTDSPCNNLSGDELAKCLKSDRRVDVEVQAR